MLPIIKLPPPSQSLNNSYKFTLNALAGAILATLSLPVWADCPPVGEITTEQTITVNGRCTYEQNQELIINVGKNDSVTLQGGEGNDNEITATGSSDNNTAIYVDNGLLTLKGGLKIGVQREYGIRLNGEGASAYVEDATVIGGYHGIGANNSGNIIVSSGATVTGKGIDYGNGIMAHNSGNITVSSGATITGSYIGLAASNSGNITVSGATVTGRRSIQAGNSGNITVSSGATVTSYGRYGIKASYSGDITVSGATVTSAERGIDAEYSGNIIVSSGATVRGEWHGAIYAFHSGNIIVSSGATVTGKGSYYGTGISSSYSGDIIVSSGATVMASRGIEAGYSGNIIVSSGATVTGTGGTSYCGGICTSYNNGDIILSSGVVKGRSIGVYVKEGFGQESPITLTLSGNAKILPVDEQTPFTRGAIHFDDDYVSSRNTLNLATDPDNIQGLVWSSIDKTGPESGPSELQNTNTLTLSGEENLSLSLSEFGVNGTDLISEGWDDIQGTKGKKFFAFDTIVKEGTGTWTLSGTLDKDIITGYTDDEGIQHLGFSINEGKIALAANTIAHTDMVVNPNGTLYSQAGGKQLIDSLAIKGTYQVDVNSHNDYSQLHSTKDIVIEDGSKLYVYADKLRGGDDTFLKHQ